MSGTGKVTIVPDVARINLGVTINKPTVKAARDAWSKIMTDVIAAMKALGIADADIQTTNLSLYPQYANGSLVKIVGYQISEQVQVTVRDLDKAGDVVDAATAKGATEVNGISFESPTRSRPRTSARGRRRRGPDERAGDGRGPEVSLGGVVSITDGTPTADLYASRAAGAGAFQTSRPRCSPGTQDLNATVTVVFAIN